MDQPQQSDMPLTFTGSGSEYFRIWIVNLLLTIVTFGFYAPWAKVRRLKYFYQNTRLAGASFNYHGQPLAILKGRLLALGLLIAWKFAPLDQIWGVAIGVVLAAIWPWIIVRSMHFKRHNSSYRNVRFRFDGETREIYLPFALLVGIFFIAAIAFYPGSHPGVPKVSHAQIAVGLLSALLLLAVLPHFHFTLQQFFATRTLFGETRFKYLAGAWDFYKIYLRLGLFFFGSVLVFAALAVAGSSMGGAGGLTMAITVAIAGLLFFYGFVLFVGPYFQVRIQNLVWNNLKLGGHRFESRARVWPFFRITLVNLLLVAFTFGFYRPFAVIRTLRYRIESISLLPAGDLDSFVASSEAAVSAFGAETTDLFDFDLSL